MLTVKRFCVSEMVLGSQDWAFKIFVDLDRRCPLKIWFHAPYKSDRSSSLDIARYARHTIYFWVGKYMFGFNKIRRISLWIQASYYESSPWSPVIFSRDEVKIGLLSYLDRWFRDENVSKYTWDPECWVFNSLELLQKLVIKSISRHVVNAIWVRFPHHSERLIVLIAWRGLTGLEVLDILESRLHILG